MKLAMVRLDRALRDAGLDAMMLLQIHDELIFEVARAQLARDGARSSKHEMEHAFELRVPIEVTLKSGRNWYDVEPLGVDALDEAVEAVRPMRSRAERPAACWRSRSLRAYRSPPRPTMRRRAAPQTLTSVVLVAPKAKISAQVANTEAQRELGLMNYVRCRRTTA